MVYKKGLLISLEGIDGSGKSTQAPVITELLTKMGYKVYLTNEPTKGRIGKLLREYLSDPTSSPYVDALLFAADRIEHYENEIKDRLDNGISVITDRYIASSVVYQGSQGVPFDWIKFVNNRVPKADLSIFIDIPIETALKRIQNSSRKVIEKFEKETALRNILENYKILFKNETFHVISGTGTKEEVTKQLVNLILNKLN